jgi:hypothetical protein
MLPLDLWKSERLFASGTFSVDMCLSIAKLVLSQYEKTLDPAEKADERTVLLLSAVDVF